MAGILGISTAAGPSPNPRGQSSVQGRPINIGAGLNRVAANLIWYGDFKATPDSSGSGGKGAGGGGKGSGSYDYSASFLLSMGQAIVQVNTVFNGNAIDFLVAPSAQVLADLAELGIVPTYGNTYGATFIYGTYPQTAWSFLTSNHPSQALGYQGESLAGFANMGLGTSPALPNFTFELLWALNSDIPAVGPDANPADWTNSFLTNPDWGVGFPTALLGDLTAYKTWCRATGMLISPVLSDQVSANSHLGDIMKGTIADFRWSSGLLTIIPYADAPITGNGYTFTPAVTPIYNILPTDFLENQGSLGNASGRSKVAVSRKDPAQILNRVQVEYLDRSNLYNPVTIYDSDDASIIASNRLRLSDLRSHHFFCLGAAASMSAAMQMRREKVVTTYQFTLPATFILVDVLDILTLTEPNLGLAAQPVRIIEIVENDDHSLTFTAEEFLGSVPAPLYPRQMSLGSARNNNAAPGSVNVPIFFEPTDAYAGGLEICAAVSGQNPELWGGCNVLVAYGGTGDFKLQGVIHGPARMGVLTALLPSIAAASAGQTIDNTNTLAVDLTESAGELSSGSLTDMTGLNTAAYVDGEIISYQTATLTAANKYSLAPMVRGAYDTPIGSHAVGSVFARLDDAIFKLPYTQDRIGATLYIKLQSFNIYGGGLEDLSTLSPFTYVITGAALASPLPNVSNLRTAFQSGRSALLWDEVSDFRTVRYEVRKGDTWITANSLGTVAHPPFNTPGDGTYWVAAVSQPAAGLMVYSETPQSLTIAGSVLVANVVAVVDEAVSGWTGSLSPAGQGMIAADTFQTTSTGVVTYYEIPAGHYFNVLKPTPISFNVEWKVVGVPDNDNVLTIADFLNDPDILQSSATQFVTGWVEIALAQSGSNDAFALPDAFAPADIFAGTIAWGPYQKYSPGDYVGQFAKLRLAIISNDAATTAAATVFKITADVPDRDDHLTDYALPSGGATIQFTPDGTSTAVPFNGGPGGAPGSLPGIQVTWNQTVGDVLSVTGKTTAHATIQILNGGVGVARTIDAIIQGW